MSNDRKVSTTKFSCDSFNQWFNTKGSKDLGVHCEPLWFPLSDIGILGTLQSLSHHGGHQSGVSGCHNFARDYRLQQKQMPILQRYNVSRNTEDLEIYGMRRSDLLGECIVQTQKGKFPCKREYHPFGIAALLPRFESQLNNHRICSSNELHQVIPILTLLTEH
ncbi:hypothetical protein TNCV_2787872 [Trichonephila clavipes]|uniref:Uncharacterized protein n=1 Tax=Trichonephila clavipes TaxID=2585209 RepID=A0A8X6SND6_TRICX|nr:hypothetical protein TNCV_2787872 [Trichonephila clavipes]